MAEQGNIRHEVGAAAADAAPLTEPRPSASTRRLRWPRAGLSFDVMEPPLVSSLARRFEPVTRWGAERGFTVPTAALVTLITVVGVRLTRRLYGTGLPQGDDAPYHLARNTFAYQQLFSHGHLDGWSPMFSGVEQLFLLYGPGLAMVSAVARVLTFGQLDNATLLSILAAVGYVATAPAMYLLARALRLSPVGAAVSGVMALGVSVIFGVGPAGTFESGLIPHQVCVPFFLIALAGVVHLVEGRSRRWLLITVGSVTFITVTHSPSVQVLTVTIVLLLLLGSIRSVLTGAGAWRLGLAAVMTVGLATWYWAPLAEESGPRPPLASWGTEPFATRLHDMFTGKDWTSPTVAAVAMIAVVVVLVRLVSTARDRQWLGPWAWSIALTGPILLGTVQVLHSRLGGDVGLSIATRGLGYSGLLCMLPLGAAADLIGDIRSRSTDEPGSPAAETSGSGGGRLRPDLDGLHPRGQAPGQGTDSGSTRCWPRRRLSTR